MGNEHRSFHVTAQVKKAWQNRPFRQSLLLRLALAMTGIQILIWALRVLFAIPVSLFDYVESVLSVIIAIPVLLASVKHPSPRLVRTLGLIVVSYVLLALPDLLYRLIQNERMQWNGTLFDLLSLFVIVVPSIYFVLADLRHREVTESQLAYLNDHDMLTGLPNRQMYQQTLTKRIRQFKGATPTRLAVMFIDLDRFKNVNDTFGHAFGDQLLIEAADRLKAGLRSCDSVSRQGGDEFTVLIDDIHDTSDAEKVAQKIIHLLSQPFSIEGHELRVGCSIGIAVYPQDGDDAITLMKNADTAMYRAKDKGKNGYSFYSAEMNDTVIQKLVMEEWLNKALEHDEFVLYYQPQVDIFSNRMNGMEALIRWNHPRLGFISPGEFIPLAEETSLIIPIGEWVLRTACNQNKAWQDAGYTPLKMAVNISPIQFHQSNFVDVVLDALRESGLEPRYLELEITEGIAMYHVDQVIQKLQTLRDLGVQISMDDFGTGYSSLTYLKRFPIHKLKIAQQFVRDVTVDPDDAAIVQAIMAMAHSLKLNVIAEGVETEEQLAFLLDIRCEEIQGYIYSRPLPPHEFVKLLSVTDRSA